MATFEVLNPDKESQPGMRNDLHTVEIDGVTDLHVLTYSDEDEDININNFVVVECRDEDESVIGVAVLRPGQIIRKKR